MNKLAIVIPFFKIDFFEETLKSVAAQTNKNFNLYIGNDASINNPLPLIDKYFKKEDYQYFDYKENLGGKNLVLQWERILDNIQEEWFQILGDDDMISENCVEAFYQSIPQLKEEKISVLKFIHEWVDEHSRLIEIFDYDADTINANDFIIKKYKGEIKSSLSENIFLTKMYRKFGFEKIPLAWGSDDLAVFNFSNFNKILYNRKAKVQVRISSSSISGSETINLEKSRAFNIFREKLIKKYSTYFIQDFIEEVIADYLYNCHKQKQHANYAVAAYFLRKPAILPFLKTIKKVYYINKIANQYKMI